MQELHNVKGSRKNGIYVDCKQLAMRLYKLSFTMAKCYRATISFA